MELFTVQNKKLIFLAVLFILCLTACSRQDTESNDGKKVITFWHTHNDEEAKTLNQIIGDYEKKTS